MTSQQTGHVQLYSCFIKPLKYLQAANLYPWVSFISRLVTQIHRLYMHIWKVHYTYINFSRLGNSGFAKKISFKQFYWLHAYLLSSWQCFVKLKLYSPYDLFIPPNLYVNDYRSFICNYQALEMTWRSFSWQTGDRLWYNHTVEFCWARERSTLWNKQVWMSLCVLCRVERPDVVSPPCWGSLSMDTSARCTVSLSMRGFSIHRYGICWHPGWLPWWLSGKGSACQCRRRRRRGFSPWVWKIPWRRKWQPTLVFLPEIPWTE